MEASDTRHRIQQLETRLGVKDQELFVLQQQLLQLQQTVHRLEQYMVSQDDDDSESEDE